MRQMLFLSSDLRRKYAEDILTALALPPGALLQFRYDAEYVAPSAQRALADESLADIEVVIGFVAGVESQQPFLLPVRYATISSVEVSAGFYLVRFKVTDHVDLAHYPVELDQLIEGSRDLLRLIRKQENGIYYPVISDPPDLRVQAGADSPIQWRETAHRLAKHPTYERSSFVRIDEVRTERGKPLAFDDKGRLRAIEGQSLRVRVSFYAGQYAPDANRVLRCQVDGTFLRASSEDVYEIVHRYDAVEFWLSPAVQDSTALAQLRLSTVDNSQDAVSVQTKAGIAVVIRRARKQLALRGVTAGVGAAFVALPAVVDQSTSIGLRVLSASIGVLLIALVAIFTGPPK